LINFCLFSALSALSALSAVRKADVGGRADCSGVFNPFPFVDFVAPVDFSAIAVNNTK
jgi:hypothetical protein